MTRPNPRSIPMVMVATAAAMVTVGAAASPALGQDTDSGWSPFLGCWRSTMTPGLEPEEGGTICLAPTSSGEIELAAVEAGEVVARDAFAAVDRQITVDRDGCRGTEATAWSADQRRLFLHENLECGNGLRRETNGIFSFDTRGDMISVEALDVAGEISVRSMRYRSAPVDGSLTDDAQARLAENRLARETSRAVASSTIDADDVIEAVQRAGAPATEAWLIELDQEFDVNPELLRYLAAADLPDSVIDLMVALSYPNVFAIDQSAREGERIPIGGAAGRWPRGRRIPPYYPAYGGGYYPGYYGGGWYGRPVIIVRDPVGEPNRDNGGRLVNGRGYTRSGAGKSEPSTSQSPSGGSTPSTGGPSAGSGDQDRAPSVRTAKPRGS